MACNKISIVEQVKLDETVSWEGQHYFETGNLHAPNITNGAIVATMPADSGTLLTNIDLAGHISDVDPHTQYHNDTRGDARYALTGNGVTNGDSHDHSGGDGAQIDHGGLAGLTDDDHPQYHNDARGDARYIQGALFLRTVYTSGTSATHIPQSAAQTLRIIAVGGGGGGGGAQQGIGQSGVSGGGGSGGITEVWWTPSGNITYTVGVGGTAGAAGNNPGIIGGDTTATGTGLALTAKGGGAGSSMAAGTTFLQAVGGTVIAGTTGGDLNIPTGQGHSGVRLGSVLGLAGDGANCGTYGNGGAGGQVNSAGLIGSGYGSGGGGAHANGTGGVDMAGGPGAGGLIIIEEYF